MEHFELQDLMKRVDASSTLNKNNVIKKVKDSLQEGNSHLYKKWEENGFNIDSAIFGYRESDTLLSSAAKGGCVKVVNALIERGADVNASGGTLTPLYDAAMYNNIEIMKILIKNGAVHKREVNGYTPLDYAVESNKVEVVSALLENIREIDVNEQFSSPLFHAIHSRYTECSKTLIKHILLYDPEAIKPHYVDGHGEMSEFWDNCQDEVKKMQKEKIDGNITFYDILTSKDENKLARYIRNKNIVEVLEESDYKSEFPVYAGEIENQYQKGIKRENLLNEGTVCIQNSDIGGKLPEEICRKVAKYLSNTDIQKLYISQEKGGNITGKAIKTSVICGVIAALTVGVGFGIANVGLSTLVIAGIAAALVVGIVAFGITYAVSRPSDKLNETYSKSAFAQTTRSPFFS